MARTQDTKSYVGRFRKFIANLTAKTGAFASLSPHDVPHMLTSRDIYQPPLPEHVSAD
jgi:hypothetical protein